MKAVSRRATQAPRVTAARRREILRLQNAVRNAVNVSRGRERKLGVDPERLRQAMTLYRIDVGRISCRAQRLPVGSDLLADYKLWQDGELLFRLKLVRWENDVDARWHVKRHPEATWWR